MEARIKLSTQFATEQDAHQVRVLITVEGKAPAERPPANVALVLDRSGSMAGEPLEAARQAAHRLLTFLGPADRISVVTFESGVERVCGPVSAGSPGVSALIDQIQEGGSTNLSGGWLEGVAALREAHIPGGMNRIVLLTDGQANRGITDLRRLAQMAAGARAEGITTTCIGFGPGFDETLLEAMADAGGGSWLYVERLDQMTGMFEEAIEGIVQLAAQNLKVRIKPRHPGLHGLSVKAPVPVAQSAEGDWVLPLGDLYAAVPARVGLAFHVTDMAELGPVILAEVFTSADVLTDDGIVHRVVKLPVTANLDGQDHPEAEVEETFLAFAAAEARRTAVEYADRGDADGAAGVLREAVTRLRESPFASAELHDTAKDLEGLAERHANRTADPSDRKYNLALSGLESRGNRGGRDKLRRG